MKKRVGGFTIIEVVLVLAIGGLMLVGALANIVTGVNRERYQDSVNDFTSFVQGIYNDVENVQITRTGSLGSRIYCTVAGQYNFSTVNSRLEYSNLSIVEDTSAYSVNGAGVNRWIKNVQNTTKYKAVGYPGRSECAVYGKLVTFGEYDANDDAQIVRVYDVIGTTTSYANNTYDTTIVNSDTISLQNVFADSVVLKREGSSCKLALAGDSAVYRTTWMATIEDTNGNKAKGSLLIARSPASSTIRTYYSSEVLRIQDIINSNNVFSCSNPTATTPSNYGVTSLYALLQSNDPNRKFNTTNDVDFCIDSEDLFSLNRRRRNIRITKDASSAAGVEQIDADSGDNRCV